MLLDAAVLSRLVGEAARENTKQWLRFARSVFAALYCQGDEVLATVTIEHVWSYVTQMAGCELSHIEIFTPASGSALQS